MRRPFARLIQRIFDRKPKHQDEPHISVVSHRRQTRNYRSTPVNNRAHRKRIRKLARAARKRNRSHR